MSQVAERILTNLISQSREQKERALKREAEEAASLQQKPTATEELPVIAWSPLRASMSASRKSR